MSRPFPEHEAWERERVEQQIAALTAELAAARAERDALREQAESACADAEVVGYYGDRADSAGQCFREAHTAIAAERDQLREALEQVQWGNAEWDPAGGECGCVYQLCPLCDQSEVRGHAPDCPVGRAMAMGGQR